MTIPVKKILETFFTERSTWQLQLLSKWPTIIGSIKTKVQLLKIYEDTLVIGVLDSCWLQELYLLSPLLIKTINENLDQPRIQKLRFKSVGLAEKKKEKEKPPVLGPQKIAQLAPREIAMLESITDEQLRMVLRDYLLRCHAQR